MVERNQYGQNEDGEEGGSWKRGKREWGGVGRREREREKRDYKRSHHIKPVSLNVLWPRLSSSSSCCSRSISTKKAKAAKVLAMDDLLSLEQICGLTDRSLVDAELNRTCQREQEVHSEIEHLTKLIEHALTADGDPTEGAMAALSSLARRSSPPCALSVRLSAAPSVQSMMFRICMEA